MASRILTMSNLHSSNSKFTSNNSYKNTSSLMASNSSSSNSSTCSNGSINKLNFSSNDSSQAGECHSKWNLGLMNSEGKYLTAENFGYKINATANTMRKKQKWLIEQDTDEIAYLISPLGCYLSTDKYGKLTCEKQVSDNDCKFYLEANGDGKLAFKSAVHGYYFGGTNDLLHCFSKTPEWWTVHLAIHPQINLRHALRKRYARLEDDEIHVDEIIPWGSDCLITIEFREEKYAIRTSNGMYLNKDGKLVGMPSEDTLFSVEFHKGCVAFKHRNGRYLTAVGPQGIVTARSKCVTKDELFMFDPNHAQVSLIAHNGKLVSLRQGVDVSANQVELNDTETFQLEEEDENEKWSLRTHTNKYWKLESGNGIQSTSDTKQSNCLFDIIWIKAGHVVFKAANGKYVMAAATGHMRAISDNISDLELFRISLVNRPILVLKCEYGK